MVRGDWGNDPIGPRAFSLMGRNDDHEVSLLGRVVGAGTERLARVRPGEHLSYLGPLGRPFPPPESADGPLLLVAGGVGLPPIYFLLEELSRSPELSARTKVLYGGRSSADILLRTELERLTSPIYVTEDGSVGTPGLVTGALEQELSVEDSGCEIFACGPEGMLKAVAAQLLDLPHRAWVCMEAPMACGIGACLGCAIPTTGDEKLKYCCIDGPVFEAGEIQWKQD
jgi:dihydroorotate dehydrogenase electron transfer subunit